MVAMVSSSTSPFLALESDSVTVITWPPSRNMAAWKEQEVRVDGSKNKLAMIRCFKISFPPVVKTSCFISLALTNNWLMQEEIKGREGVQ
jgi:hypothetical protein